MKKNPENAEHARLVLSSRRSHARFKIAPVSTILFVRLRVSLGIQSERTVMTFFFRELFSGFEYFDI